ncbi:PQQ-binding-like beta-propeller repeat protein [Variovorax sp. EBFNA2]|uniref:PQQ-binding-like beta-propeller repeat protein n=1 Tax=Variovorax sp. EBFNA2 TaxID=3342097 RepID=UPI0029C05332|nr:PQQ-binding-like beta-propeller repeat protein [Variovorax boronicumulans]WPG41285.1 PQQ-binding-like beta-propeller repeat protein [Variovorax boronicumulans]
MKPIWTFRLPKEREVGARNPVAGEDTVLVAFHYDKADFYESALVALDRVTGQERWRRAIPHVVNEPVLASDGSVYVSSFSGTVHAYDSDGKELWDGRCGDSNMGKPCLVANDRLVVAETGGRASKTWCLDRRTGSIVWTFENHGHSYGIATNNERIVHATVLPKDAGVRLHCLEASSGRSLWAVDSREWMFHPLVGEQTVVIGARGSLRAYSLQTGVQLSKLELQEQEAIDGHMLLSGDRIYFATDCGRVGCASIQRVRSFFKSKLSLKSEWHCALEGGIRGRPAMMGSALGVLCEEEGLVLLDPATGQRLSAFRTGKGNGGGLVYDRGWLYGTLGREARAFGPE